MYLKKQLFAHKNVLLHHVHLSLTGLPRCDLQSSVGNNKLYCVIYLGVSILH